MSLNMICICGAGKGEYCTGTACRQCMQCSKGKFKEERNQYECSLCPRGTYNSKLGQQTFSSCRTCPGETLIDIHQRCYILFGQQTFSSCRTCPGETLIDIHQRWYILFGQQTFSSCHTCPGEISTYLVDLVIRDSTYCFICIQ
jgi:hypothetical protein